MVTNLVRDLTAHGYALLLICLRPKPRFYALIHAFKYDVPFVVI